MRLRSVRYADAQYLTALDPARMVIVSVRPCPCQYSDLAFSVAL
jgi:hypothetical protein